MANPKDDQEAANLDADTKRVQCAVDSVPRCFGHRILDLVEAGQDGDEIGRRLTACETALKVLKEQRTDMTRRPC